MSIQERRRVRVQGKLVGDGCPVFLIAEIGTSHRGDVGLAVRLIEEAARCGVDAVKLQSVDADESYGPSTASYSIFKKLWFDYEDLLTLKRAAEAHGVILFSTPGDLKSLGLLCRVGLPLLKISSGLLTNYPLIRKVAGSSVPVLISTGMSFLDEVGQAVRVVEENGCREVMLLHCSALYPCPPDRVNLNAMRTMRNAFPCPVGYSDHTIGITAAVAAATLGANLIEKHFVLDRQMELPDGPFAADPKEMGSLAEEIRKVEAMMGDGVKAPSEEEVLQRESLRRCLVARRDLKPGDPIEEGTIGFMRVPKKDYGLSPFLFPHLEGKKVFTEVRKGEVLSWAHLTKGAEPSKGGSGGEG